MQNTGRRRPAAKTISAFFDAHQWVGQSDSDCTYPKISPVIPLYQSIDAA